MARVARAAAGRAPQVDRLTARQLGYQLVQVADPLHQRIHHPFDPKHTTPVIRAIRAAFGPSVAGAKRSSNVVRQRRGYEAAQALHVLRRRVRRVADTAAYTPGRTEAAAVSRQNVTTSERGGPGLHPACEPWRTPVVSELAASRVLDAAEVSGALDASRAGQPFDRDVSQSTEVGDLDGDGVPDSWAWDSGVALSIWSGATLRELWIP